MLTLISVQVGVASGLAACREPTVIEGSLKGCGTLICVSQLRQIVRGSSITAWSEVNWTISNRATLVVWNPIVCCQNPRMFQLVLT